MVDGPTERERGMNESMVAMLVALETIDLILRAELIIEKNSPLHRISLVLDGVADAAAERLMREHNGNPRGGGMKSEKEIIVPWKDALEGLYDLLPRHSCHSSEPDGCPVCVARKLLRGPE
jgi:hypothetical protein